MNANEVIEAYVTEVALKLPRKQRNDVAFELRALLHEELQGRSEAAGRVADAAMTTEFLNAFGHPAEVAARYRPTLIIIDAADGHAFWRAASVGLALIWSLGLWSALNAPIGSGWDLLSALGRWWVGTVLPSLWWPGVLVSAYGMAAWVRRRWPQTSLWQPRDPDRLRGGRAALAMAIVGILCGVSILIEPRWLLDVVFSGRAAPAAYEALTYAEGFRQRQGPLLLGLILLNIPLLLSGIVNGRWSSRARRLELPLALATCAAMLWSVVAGPIFMTPASDQTTKFLLLLIVAAMLIGYAIRWLRRVRPNPR